MSDKIRTLRKSFETGSRAAAPQPAPGATQSGPRKNKSSSPIILISSSPTALLTMWNVKRFLEQGM
jgi:parafibromin